MTATMTKPPRDRDLDRLLSTPAGRQIAAEYQAEQYAKRREAADAIATHQALFDAELPALAEECARAEQHAADLAKQLANANAVHVRARLAIAQAKRVCEANCVPHQRYLRDSADSRIAELMTEIGEESRKNNKAPIDMALAQNAGPVCCELRDVVSFEALTEEQLVARLSELRQRCGL